MTDDRAVPGVREVPGVRDIRDDLTAAVREAVANRGALVIEGHGTKGFLYEPAMGGSLPTSGHCGVMDYDASELVLSARCGTPIAELESTLAESNQMLPFDPPRFFADSARAVSGGGTFGGALAAGFAGPARPWLGSVRDAVLGVELLTGRAEVLRFGGKVMKNVAGYDISRLVVGSHGTLGVILSASIRVLPRPELECTLRFECDRLGALERVVGWGRSPLPMTATCHVDGVLSVRLAGNSAGVREAQRRMGGETVDDAARFWADVRDHRLRYFPDRTSGQPAARSLWRLSLPTAAPFPELEGEWLTEWGGALRWLTNPTRADSERVLEVREATERLGGFAHLFSARGGFQPLAGNARVYHQRLKDAFDPDCVLNRNRYPACG